MCRAEQWMWVDGFEGYYKISNYGRLMSFHKDKQGQILSVKNGNNGYLTVHLRGKNKRLTTRIHLLVAKAFIGDIPDGYEVHHIDGNKQNNTMQNLEIISKKEHRVKTMAMMPDYCDGMNRYNKYERTRRIRQYTPDGQFIAEYVNGAVASHYTGICHRNILQVASKSEYKPGKVRKQAGGFVWRYAEEDD